MTAETFLNVLIAIMVIGGILGLGHTRRFLKRLRSHHHHTTH